MHALYRPLHTMPKVPDMPVGPPELDDATWEKNNRNSIRREAIDALGTVISRLNELDHLSFELSVNLAFLRDKLRQEMED